MPEGLEELCSATIQSCRPRSGEGRELCVEGVDKILIGRLGEYAEEKILTGGGTGRIEEEERVDREDWEDGRS